MMKFFRKLIRLLIALLIFGMASCAVVLLLLYTFASDLPDHNGLLNYSPSVATRVFLRDGSKLCEYADERRYFIPYNRIPQKLINAFVAAEDKHFFTHKGVDPLGIIRSVLKNLENIGTGRRPQGASTITQQVARIFLIQNNEISYIRKLKEAILSFRIESSMTKQQIIELYLNQLYMGLGRYGVAAAAKVYFDKSVHDLTIAECAYMASLAKGAGNYHPLKHKDRAIKRRNWVLQRQLEDGYLTAAEVEQAQQEDLHVVMKVSDNSIDYFAEEVRKVLREKVNNINSSGLIVRATLSPDMQKAAYIALRSGLERIDRGFGWRGPIKRIQYTKNENALLVELKNLALPKGAEEFVMAVVIDHNKTSARILTTQGEKGELAKNDLLWAKKLSVGDVILVKRGTNKQKAVWNLKQIPQVQGAMVVIETDTGRILAMQGGYSFHQSEFNRVTQAQRQMGSVFKPFVYLAGLENGFAPNTIIDASSLEIDLGNNLGVWKPQNYHGQVLDKVTFRRALERSINTATIRIAQSVGIDRIGKLARQFELFDSMPPYLSYAIGAGETTLLKLTTAYAIFANGGKKIVPTLIDYIQDRYGNPIFVSNECQVDESYSLNDDMPPQLHDKRPQIIDAVSVYQITSLLEGVIQRGSAASAAKLAIPIAGKTGTTNHSRDTWFIGYTPDIAVGVFVGFDDFTRSLGRNANGANTALPIFIDFMERVKRHLKPRPFKVPCGVKLRQVDSETGEQSSSNGHNLIWEAFREDESENTPLIEPSDQDSSDKAVLPADDIKPISGIY